MKKIILKYLIGNISNKELESLILWLQKSKNQDVFKQIVRENYNLDIKLRSIDSNTGWLKVKPKLKDKSGLFFSRTIKYAAAACLIGILVTGYVFKDNLFSTPQSKTPIIVNNNIEHGTDKAILTLDTGEIITLEKDRAYQIPNATSNGKEIVYGEGEKQDKQVVYNTLTVPRGGQFKITIADGTQVWLNSESQIKYPVSFTEGETRQVELVYGEAYFDVVSSAEYKGSDFKVYNNNQEIKVLGTEFNIKAYKDESYIYTTLVEGKITINTVNQNQILIPNQQAILNTKDDGLLVQTVNATTETLWRQGIFSFRGKPLGDIMKVISRWYDVNVVFEDKNMKDFIFVGVLNKDQNIVDLMDAVRNSSFISTYMIDGKTIIIK
ncbi:FecR family protein [Flavivirga sp. 57AJ16]|uniref:FecR family protein n=1 Tax=Flavivirga sp. 57AJ16 TaxID=3025307 RepID=UPI0023655060|nr:FecR family protein [Flavivirga sp. 57AJ16]MDD7886926.1 DUF4974 domain-containing protein [Flavivirga sp. 57AJ16]